MKYLYKLFAAAESRRPATDEATTSPRPPRASALYSVTFEQDCSDRREPQETLPTHNNTRKGESANRVSFFARAGDHCSALEAGWWEQNCSIDGGKPKLGDTCSAEQPSLVSFAGDRCQTTSQQQKLVGERHCSEENKGEPTERKNDSEDEWILVDAIPKDITSYPKKYSEDFSNEIEKHMALDKTDIDLIRASWVPVREDPGASGLLLFKELFTKFPKYKDFFPQFADLDLERMYEHKRLNKHALKVIETVTFVVDTIGDETKAAQLGEALTNLVKSHLMRNVGLPEFRNLGIILIDFICDINRRGAKLDTNLLVTAWTKLYSIILDVVKQESGAK